MANPNPIEAREAALKSPNIGKRGKGKLTLIREQAQEEFDKLAKEKYLDIFLIHINEASKLKNYQERRDFLKRILGETDDKAEKHLHLHKHEEDTELTEAKKRLIREYEDKLKELKTK